MKNITDSSPKRNTPRIVLYIATVLICVIFIYVHKYITPKLNVEVKEKTLSQIQVLYSQQKYEMALQVCQSYIANYPREAQVLVWMGMSLDGIGIQLEIQKKELANIEARIKKPGLRADQKAMLQAQKTALLQQIQKWQDKDLVKYREETFRKAIKYAGPKQTQIALMVTQSYLAKQNYSAVVDILQNIETKTPLAIAEKAIVELQLYHAKGENQPDYVLQLQNKASQAIKLIELLSAPEKEKIFLPTYFPYWGLAKAYRMEGKLAEASEYYAKSCQIQPMLHVYQDLASVLEETGKYLQQAEVLKKIEEMRPSIEVKYKLAKAHMNLWSLEASWKYLEEALYLSNQQKDSTVYNNIHKDSVWKKCYDQPQFQLLIGWEKIPNPNQARLIREAIHCTLEKQFDGALHYIQQVENQNPDVYPALMLKLYVKLQKVTYYKAWQKRVKDNDKLIQSDTTPQEQKTHLQKENQGINEQIKQYTVDISTIKKDISSLENKIKQLRPNSGIALANAYFQAYGIIRSLDLEFRQELLQKAKESLELTSLDSLSKQEQGFSQYVLFIYYKQQKDLDKAFQCLEKTIEYDIANPRYGMVYLQELPKLLSNDQEKQKQKTIALAQKITPYIKELPLYLNNVGEKLMSVEQYQTAMEFFQAALQSQENNSISLFFLATSYLHQANEEKALEYLEKSFQGTYPEYIPRMLDHYKVWKTMDGKQKYIEILNAQKKQ